MRLIQKILFFLLIPTPLLANSYSDIFFSSMPLHARSAGMAYTEVSMPSLSVGVLTNPGVLGFSQELTCVFNSHRYTGRSPRRFFAASYHLKKIGTVAIGYNRQRYVPQVTFDGNISDSYYISNTCDTDVYSLSFGTAFLNMIGIGATLNRFTGTKIQSDFPYGDVLRIEYDDWLLNIGMLFKSPIFRFRSSYIDDEFRAGVSINQIGLDNADTQKRYGAAYEIAPVIFIPSLDRDVHPIRIIFAYERMTPFLDIQGEKNAKSWGMELNFGGFLSYRFGSHTTFSGGEDNTQGFGLQLPLDILTKDELPIWLEYDRADCRGSKVYHSIKIKIRFEGRLSNIF
ncbi:MAG: hypothetical protein B6244_00130 [Candidatus Cloacimonetes bacterium 4572_55]|nr:MAG: hypothetical protein B6244_00130 [Candidatus Cloacimonetes bacterium 4572_55]